MHPGSPWTSNSLHVVSFLHPSRNWPATSCAHRCTLAQRILQHLDLDIEEGQTDAIESVASAPAGCGSETASLSRARKRVVQTGHAQVLPQRFEQVFACVETGWLRGNTGYKRSAGALPCMMLESGSGSESLAADATPQLHARWRILPC